jgi:hypothetical protein
MDKIIGTILGLVVVMYVIAAIVWVIQWIAATAVLIYDIALMPLVVYFLPGVLAVLVTAGLFWGSGIAVHNYFSAMQSNITPQDILGSVIRYFLLIVLSLSMAAIYIPIAGYSGFFTYQAAVNFEQTVEQHYQSVQYPAFRIVFPFWDK